MCWGSSVFTPTIWSLTLFMRCPVALMSFAFSCLFMPSCLYLKHMASRTVPTHVTSDPTTRWFECGVGCVLCSRWSHFVSLHSRLEAGTINKQWISDMGKNNWVSCGKVILVLTISFLWKQTKKQELYKNIISNRTHYFWESAATWTLVQVILHQAGLAS